MLMEGSCASMAPTSLSLVWHPSPATYAWTLPLCSLVSLCYRTRCLLLCCLSGRLLSLFLMCASFLCKAGLGCIQFGTALFVLLPAFFLWSLAGSSLGSIAETSSILLEQWGGEQQTVPCLSVEAGEKNIQIHQSLSTEIILSTKFRVWEAITASLPFTYMGKSMRKTREGTHSGLN